MLQYLYLNQIPAHTKGKAEPEHILHAAANGSIRLFAHIPELAAYGSRLAPVSSDDCPLIERDYNYYCSFNEREEFAESAFILSGEITEQARNGTQPFKYALYKPSGSAMDTPRLQEFDVIEGEIKAHKIIAKLYGSDFVVLKDDVDALLSPADTDCKEIPPHLEALPHKFQQLYAAIAGGELPDLEAAINAWYLHWHERPERGERDTYPKNPNIQAWLEDRGVSRNKAESIPPLIRPKWG